MDKGMEKLLAGSMVLLIIAITLINFSNATTDIPNVSEGVNSLEKMLLPLLLVSGIAVALGSVVYWLRRSLHG